MGGCGSRNLVRTPQTLQTVEPQRNKSGSNVALTSENNGKQRDLGGNERPSSGGSTHSQKGSSKSIKNEQSDESFRGSPTPPKLRKRPSSAGPEFGSKRNLKDGHHSDGEETQPLSARSHTAGRKAVWTKLRNAVKTINGYIFLISGDYSSNLT